MMDRFSLLLLLIMPSYLTWYKLQPFWSSMVMKKWLNIRPKLNDFSEDEFDTGSEDSGMRNCMGILYKFLCLYPQ
jgi:hypothetical protein